MISVEKTCEIATKERKEPFVESIIDVGYGMIEVCFPILVYKKNGNVEYFRIPEYIDDIKNGKNIRIPVKYKIPKVVL